MLAETTRVAVLECIDWPAVAAQHELHSRGKEHGAVAVLHAQRVVARTSEAARNGVLVGMRRREAQAACPQLHIAPSNPERDRLMFEPVVQSVAQLVPLVEVSTPGIIVLATRGPSRYVGGDTALAQRLHAMVEHVLVGMGNAGVASFGVGVADGRLAAHVAARHAATIDGWHVVDVGASQQCLSQLPVAVLADFAEIDRSVVSLLQRLGIAHLADIAAVQLSVLTGRFGPVGEELHRLARGIDRHPPVTVAPPPDRASVHRFELPVEDINTVVFAVRVVADELAAHLGAHGASCVRLHVSLQTDHGEQSERVWYQPEGLTAAAMAERVRWQMEAWVATRGVTSGVVLVRLSPVGVRAREGRQLGLWGGSSEADEWAARAVERLVALLGPHSVHVAEWKGGRDAGEVFVLAPTAVIDMQRRSESVVTNEQQWSGALPTPSPSLIYAEPLPAMVIDAENNVLRVNGRHELSAPPACVVIGQYRYSVVSWAGPWPVEECWWDPLRHRRLVRIQLVLQGIIAGGPQAVLLALEHGEWWVLGKFG